MSTEGGLLNRIRACLGLNQQQEHEAVEMREMENGRELPIRVVEPGCAERIRRAWRSCSRGKQLGIVACTGFVIGSIVTGAAAAVASAMSAPSMNPQSSPMNSNSDMSDFTITSKLLPTSCVLDCQSRIYQPLNVYPYSAYPDSEIRKAIESCESYTDLICFKTVEKKEVEAPNNGFEQTFCINTKTKKEFVVNKDGCQTKQQPIFHETKEMKSCVDYTLPKQCSFMFDQPSSSTVKPTIAPTVKTTTVKPTNIATSNINSYGDICYINCNDGFHKPFSVYSKGNYDENQLIQRRISNKCPTPKSLHCFKKETVESQVLDLNRTLIYCFKDNNFKDMIRLNVVGGRVECGYIAHKQQDNIQTCLTQVMSGPCSSMFNVEEHGSGEGSGEGLIWPVSTKQPSVIPATSSSITSTYNAESGTCDVDLNDGYIAPFTVYSNGKFGGNNEVENNIKECDSHESLNCFEKRAQTEAEFSNRNKMIFCVKKNNPEEIFRPVSMQGNLKCDTRTSHVEDVQQWFKKISQGPCSPMFNVEEHGSGEGSSEGLIWPVSTKQPSVIPTKQPSVIPATSSSITSTYNAKAGTCDVNVNDGNMSPFIVYSAGKFGGNAEIENNIKKCDLPESLNCFEKRAQTEPKVSDKNKRIVCVRNNNLEDIFRPVNTNGHIHCVNRPPHMEDVQQWFKKISQGPCSPMFNVEEHGSGEGSGEGLIWPVSTKQPSVIPKKSIISTYNAEEGTCDVNIKESDTLPFIVYSEGKFGGNAEIENSIKKCNSPESLNCFERNPQKDKSLRPLKDRKKRILCVRKDNPEKIFRPVIIEENIECSIVTSHVEDVIEWFKKISQGPCSSMFNFDKQSTSKTTTVNPRSSMGYVYSKTARSTTRRSTTPTSRMIKV